MGKHKELDIERQEKGEDMSETYTVKLNRFDVEQAARKLIKQETNYCPDEDGFMLEHTHFYGIKLESVSFDCDEGDFEWIYMFTDDGSLKRWGETD